MTSQIYQDSDILLGYVYTDEGIQNSAEFPTVAVMAPFEKNPQMIMWDPETYPNVKTIADLGTEGVLIRCFGGAAAWSTTCPRACCPPTRSTRATTARRRAGWPIRASRRSRASARPSRTSTRTRSPRGKDVAYAYINDEGWNNYAEALATKPENIETYADCFTALVPIIQQATVDYVKDPARTNALIIEAVDTFDNGWVYSQGVADYGVATMLSDGLIANGPDSTLGNFDEARIDDLIAKAIPVYTALGTPPKDGLTAADLVTNQFVDMSIGL
ncbi:MAG: hypothetical protein R2705_03285 [Ilumatobacteraceae bacterium]